MAETTMLVVAGRKLKIRRTLKRTLQVGMAVALTVGVLFVVIVGNGFLAGKAGPLQGGFAVWLAFIKRTDILSTIVLTALVSVLFVYWQRDHEQRSGGSGRISG